MVLVRSNGVLWFSDVIRTSDNSSTITILTYVVRKCILGAVAPQLTSFYCTFMFVDVCDCPLLVQLQQAEDYQPIPRVHLCRQTEFSSVACNCTPGPSCSVSWQYHCTIHCTIHTMKSRVFATL